LLQELFESRYFCQEQQARHFARAHEAASSPLLAGMQRLARELGVVLPVSFFERDQQAYFNSLLMVDADMTFDPTALELLVRAAEASREDDTVPDIHVIGGLCAAFGNDGAGNVRIISTVFDVGEDKPGIGVPTFRNATAKEVPFKSIKQVYGTGAAFLLIHRQVLVDIAAAVGKLYPWFREQIVEDDRPDIAWHERNDYWISEDLFFCMQAQRCGYPIFVHTGVEIGHIKSIKLTPDLFRFQPTLVEMA
jgi:hypothetical protein